MFIVYKATAPSGKVYIGFTKETLKKRRAQHIYESKRPRKPFQYAIRKYGSKIKWEVICSYETRAFALNRERFFIKQYSSNVKDLGYNCTSGGEGASDIDRSAYRKWIIDEKGNLFHGAEAAALHYGLSVANVRFSIRHSYWCGDHYFSHYQPEMVKAVAPNANLPKRRRQVLNITTGKVYDSLKEVAQSLGVLHQAVYRVCASSSKRLKVNGQYLCYLEDSQVRKQIIQNKKNTNKFSRKIIDENGTVFPSLSDAGRSVGASAAQIHIGIRDRSQVRGVSFSFYEKGMTASKKYSDKRKSKVLCHQTNTTYESCAEAARQLGLTCRGTIHKVANKERKQYQGYTFEYITIRGGLSQL